MLVIDCFTLAIGPVKHDLPLNSAENGKSIVGRLQFSADFQHVCNIMVNLIGIKFEFEGKHEHNYYFTLQAQTPESTVDANTKSDDIRPTYESDVNRSFIRIGSASYSPNETKLPSISLPASYYQLSSSCLKIALWLEPEGKSTLSHPPLGIIDFLINSSTN